MQFIINVPSNLEEWPLAERLIWWSKHFNNEGGRRLAATLQEAAIELKLQGYLLRDI